MSVWKIAKQCILLQIYILTITGHKIETTSFSTFFGTNVKDSFFNVDLKNLTKDIYGIEITRRITLE